MPYPKTRRSAGLVGGMVRGLDFSGGQPLELARALGEARALHANVIDVKAIFPRSVV